MSLLLAAGSTPPPTAGQPWYLWQQSRVQIEAEWFDTRRRSLYWWQGTVPAVSGGQPWYLWVPTTQRLEAEGFERHSIPDINLYRQATQTVGQPFRAMQSVSGGSASLESYEAPRAAPDLHRYRTGFQTVGQPYSLLAFTGVRLPPEPESYESRRPDQYWWWATSIPVVIGQPYYLLYWQSTRQRSESEEYRVTSPSLYWWWTTPFIPAPPATGLHPVNMGVTFGMGLSWMGTRI